MPDSPPRDFTSVLGLLLSDGPLLARFLAEPSAALDGLGVREQDRAALASLDRAALARQAEMLLDKRFHEAARSLPRTLALVGRAAPALFRELVGPAWPVGHERHLVDALRFHEALRARGLRVDRGEGAQLAVRLGTRRFALALGRGAFGKGRRRRALLVLWRARGRARRLALHLRW